MSRRLRNYVRTYRKCAGLSQDEVAFLLGYTSGTRVSRYERFARLPDLTTVFGYQVIFGASARDLFSGVFIAVEKKIARRADVLVRRLAGDEDGSAQKLELLNAIVSRAGALPNP